MKKIVTLGAIAVLSAGFMFADEPAADVSITEFSGNAKVTWGMDLDAGKTGFKNTEEANFKVKLFSSGDKVTEGEGIWAELKIKSDDGLKNENGTWTGAKAVVDNATLHFNDFFVGIREGDAMVGEYKFDGAIRSADSDHAKYAENVGPNWNDNWQYKYGIQAGYDSSDLFVKVDLRSLMDTKKENTQYTNSYAVALEAGLKDSNQWLEGLFVDGGFGYNLSGEFYKKGAVDNGKEDDLVDDGKGGKKKQYYFDADTGTAKVKQKDKSGISDSPVNRSWLVTLSDDEVKANKLNGVQNGHVFGYGFKAGYKYKIDDTYFVKPVALFEGSSSSLEVNYGDNKWGKATSNSNGLGFGVILGWGETKDDNAGVPFLDGDMAKKVTPGVSVIARVPLAYTETLTTDKTTKATYHGAVIAEIIPSFYTNSDLVEGLKAGLYSEIALLNYKQDPDKDEYVKSYTHKSGDEKEVWSNAALRDEKFAFALAGGVSYDIKSDDITVTPKAGFRYANRAYKENSIEGRTPFKADPVFKDMGSQDTIRYDSDKKFGKKDHFAGDFFNLKASVDVAGLINNTTFSVEYASANLLNKINYTSEKLSVNGAEIDNPYYKLAFNQKWYNVKLGTLDIGCKISF